MTDVVAEKMWTAVVRNVVEEQVRLGGGGEFRKRKRNICGSYYHGIVWDTAANKWAVEDQEEEGWRRERARRILRGSFGKRQVTSRTTRRRKPTRAKAGGEGKTTEGSSSRRSEGGEPGRQTTFGDQGESARQRLTGWMGHLIVVTNTRRRPYLHRRHDVKGGTRENSNCE